MIFRSWFCLMDSFLLRFLRSFDVRRRPRLCRRRNEFLSTVYYFQFTFFGFWFIAGSFDRSFVISLARLTIKVFASCVISLFNSSTAQVQEAYQRKQRKFANIENPINENSLFPVDCECLCLWAVREWNVCVCEYDLFSSSILFLFSEHKFALSVMMYGNWAKQGTQRFNFSFYLNIGGNN